MPGAVVFSHWLLHLVVHHADVPILPGNAGGLPRLGFGPWRYPPAVVVLEMAVMLGGACLCWRAALSAGPFVAAGIVPLALDLLAH